jgi:hypothetical protein
LGFGLFPPGLPLSAFMFLRRILVCDDLGYILIAL